MTLKADLEQRVEDIVKAVEASAGQHNALLGRLNEAKFILEQVAAKELAEELPEVEAVAEKKLEAMEHAP